MTTDTVPEISQSWRDIADQLPGDVVAQLERAEELNDSGARPWECSCDDSDAIMTHFAITERLSQHRAGVRFANVPLPAVDDIRAEQWFNIGAPDKEEWTRSLIGPTFTVDGVARVCIEGTQTSGGTVEWGLCVDGDVEDATAAQARLLASALTEAADALDRITR
ncbi:hypothetical protein [Mycobacteroides abscessus]|uniref:hypothetical protein n=1 Tax=Mycobacteroides abscessus TaxID=36809 RepID=UPI0005E82F7B|nr:hypothetical protein [Mycobacteroides abscessus]CPS10346.1 Uncharacterised protein [Mycobacteroides abscessus]CPS26492.1 Uncharacterised protein [Mycobacteroides abscessus]CPS29016.1 Uncharacterised protein [Mycobacteroides abscessus]CPT09892.1 Uncharacterised protein [Mycobacteroides abscessus]CPT29449.1 Uncharacterised protein [Mycobacteroides abscessus]